VGSRVDGTIVAGATNSYTFSLSQARQLYFDSLTSSGNISWELVGPRGSVVSSRPFSGSDAAYFTGSLDAGSRAG